MRLKCFLGGSEWNWWKKTIEKSVWCFLVCFVICVKRRKNSLNGNIIQTAVYCCCVWLNVLLCLFSSGSGLSWRACQRDKSSHRINQWQQQDFIDFRKWGRQQLVNGKRLTSLAIIAAVGQNESNIERRSEKATDLIDEILSWLVTYTPRWPSRSKPSCYCHHQI